MSESDPPLPLSTHPSTHPSNRLSTQFDNDDGDSFWSSLFGAITRSLGWSLAFYFKSPIKLFRPVKISSWTAIKKLVEDDNAKAISGKKPTTEWSALRNLWRREGWRFIPRHLLPPIAINTLISLILFGTYTHTSAYLTTNTTTSPHSVAFLAGAAAGGAQSLFSIPLDNIRQHLATSSYKSWSSLLRDMFFLPPPSSSDPHLKQFESHRESSTMKSKNSNRRRTLLIQYANKGFSMGTLIILKDILGFGSFFLIFETFRSFASNLSNSSNHLRFFPFVSNRFENDEDVEDVENLNVENVEKRKSLDLIFIQALIILTGGTLSASLFILIGKPFDRAKNVVFRTRELWILKNQKERENLFQKSNKPPTIFQSLRFETKRNGLNWLFKPNVGRRSRVWTVIPPYALGFLVYAVMNGDLQP